MLEGQPKAVTAADVSQDAERTFGNPGRFDLNLIAEILGPIAASKAADVAEAFRNMGPKGQLVADLVHVATTGRGWQPDQTDNLYS